MKKFSPLLSPLQFNVDSIVLGAGRCLPTMHKAMGLAPSTALTALSASVILALRRKQEDQKFQVIFSY